MKMKLLDDEIRRWLRAREIGCTKTIGIGHQNRISKQLFSAITKVRSWNPVDTVKNTHHGGIFNFDFSQDGSVLVAACEKRSILVFDPLNGQLINAREKAHNDCVNCVKFLDSRVFATCSDDTSVALWDVRYLKHKIRTLGGHSNWVKNIEYDSSSGLLVTSGFDGSIFTWDINRYSESDEYYKQVFHTNGLMRTKLTPEASKLIIATSTGYLMVVHDLDLQTLGTDLKDFKPSMYRLMQQTGSLIAQAYNFNHVFTRKRNRVELISDFPSENDAEMIASLEVHPQGWCVVSRNTSNYEAHEWTCVHDIQTPVGFTEDSHTTNDTCHDAESDPHLPSVSNKDEEHRTQPVVQRPHPARTELPRTTSPSFVLSISINESSSSPPEITHQSRMSPIPDARDDIPESLPSSSGDTQTNALISSSRVLDLTQSMSHCPTPEPGSSGGVDPDRSRESDSDDDEIEPQAPHTPPPSPIVRYRRLRNARTQNRSLGAERDSRSNSPATRLGRRLVTQARSIRQRNAEAASGSANPSVSSSIRHSGSNAVQATLNSTAPVPISAGIRLGESLTVFIQSERRGGRPLFFVGHNKSPSGAQPIIHQPVPRLTHYIEELNVGRGFIKEVSFSSDGRLICSPFGFGVRLLTFDPNCSEMCDVIPTSPVKLYELTTNMSHTTAVVTTKFSPVHCLFVSGCLSGKVDFHQPLL